MQALAGLRRLGDVLGDVLAPREFARAAAAAVQALAERAVGASADAFLMSITGSLSLCMLSCGLCGVSVIRGTAHRLEVSWKLHGSLMDGCACAEELLALCDVSVGEQQGLLNLAKQSAKR